MTTPPEVGADDRPKTKRRHRAGPKRTPIGTHLVGVLQGELGPLRFLISGDEQRWLPLRLWLHIALFFGIAVASVFGLWLIFQGLFSAGLKDELKIEVIRLILYIIAGIGGVFALVIAYRRQGLNEAAEIRVERAEAREESKVFNERFKSASEQLSSEQAANRLAGAYAMAGLADDWDQGRQTCINVLCAYLRMPFDPPTGELPPEGADSAERAEHRAEERARSQEAQVRETIVSAIRARLREAPTAGRTWHSCDFDFTKAYFDDADFSGILVTGGVMSFRKIVHRTGLLDFNGLVVTGGQVVFDEAVFSDGRVRFSKAKISGGHVKFNAAVFAGGRISFNEAALAGGKVSFYAAECTGGQISFYKTRFSGGVTRFISTSFSGSQVYFNEAEFSGGHVDLNAAKFSSGKVDLSGARYVGGEIETADFQSYPVRLLPNSRLGDRIADCLKLPPGWVEGLVDGTSESESPRSA